MANHVGDQSKLFLCRCAREMIRQQIKFLTEVGCSYKLIEEQLRLIPNGGATVHSIIRNDKTRKFTVPMHDLFQQIHELLTERTDDLFDEEGFPTQETNELVTKIEAILKQGDATWVDDSTKTTCPPESAKAAEDTSPHT